MSTPRATTRGVAADHAAIATRRPNALVATVLRTGSVHAREVMAELAWPGRTPQDVAAWAASSPQTPPPGADPRPLGDLARVLALQPGHDGHVRPELGRAILEALSCGRDWVSAPRAQVELLMQLRLLHGDVPGALAMADDRRIRPDVADAVRADALNPVLGPGGDPVRWATAFSHALHGDALAPYLPPQDGIPHLDRLTVAPSPAVRGKGLVSVLMSTYLPGPALLTAVRSVLDQTWPELELLVVDDASGHARPHASLLDQVAELDPRVQVIRKAVNGGTYRARNTALRRARGDFFVVVDSDDRWHPQTLELCLAPLLADPSLLATRAEGVRVPESLLLTRSGYRPRFRSAATVLFRLREVMGRIGFFDPTRKGADTEYARRLEASCGPVILDVPVVTTLLRGGGDTLSSGEFRGGWRHPARHQYKSLYGAWHARIAAGEASAYLDPDEPRVFAEPLRWSRAADPALERPPRVDLCLAGDWRRYGGPQRSMVEEIRAARAAGLTVAVMHLEALRFMGGRDVPVTPEVVRLVEEGEVSWVLPDDDVEIGVLMIRYPPILQYPPTLPSTVRARHVLVMANQAPLERDGSDQRYVVADVTARTRVLFGGAVQWIPQSPHIRDLLLEQDPDVPLVAWDDPGLIDPRAWRVRADRVPGRDGPVVVGRHSRDDRIKFPGTWAELERGYAFPAGYKVRMLGGERTVESLRQAHEGAVVPRSWEVLAHAAQDVQGFLAGLDFYLYLDNADAHESFGRTLLEAAASGVLTIAHPKHQKTFGDLFDYAWPGEAQDLIAHYVGDPEAYAERVARTREAVAQRYSHAGFVSHILELLGGSPATESRAGDPARSPTTLTVRLRSTADAERADSLRVVHRCLDESELEPWVDAVLAATRLRPPRDEQALEARVLGSAPVPVDALTMRRDGVTFAWRRDRGGGWRREAFSDPCAAGD